MESTLILSTAFGLGAAHALEPGHGKTLVAAYMTGTKGKLSDAFMLGALVTIFHTLTVFILVLVGIQMANLFVQFDNTLYKFLDVFSGVIILIIGLMLFWRRFIVDKNKAECECHIRHVHHDDHVEVKKKASNFKELVSLGLASGITPCPLTLSILITSVNSGRYSLPEALMCLFLFSMGLSSVLVMIGAALILSEGRINRLFISKDSKLPMLVSKFSTVLIIILGLYLTITPFLAVSGEPEHAGHEQLATDRSAVRDLHSPKLPDSVRIR